jgi:predicted transcriptional regulator
LQDALSRRRQPLQQRRRVLVAAVLGPEQREDRELEVVRLAFEKTPDSLELAVRESERAVQRLFRNLRQAFSVAPGSEVASAR